MRKDEYSISTIFSLFFSSAPLYYFVSARYVFGSPIVSGVVDDDDDDDDDDDAVVVVFAVVERAALDDEKKPRLLHRADLCSAAGVHRRREHRAPAELLEAR